jgi:hypothetical protein
MQVGGLGGRIGSVRWNGTLMYISDVYLEIAHYISDIIRNAV